jgi:hypothetical protein
MGRGRRTAELVLPMEVEQCGLCDGDACWRVVPFFSCAFGTLGVGKVSMVCKCRRRTYSQLPLLGRVCKPDGDPASGVVPSSYHPPVKTFDDLLGTGSRLEPMNG